MGDYALIARAALQAIRAGRYKQWVEAEIENPSEDSVEHARFILNEFKRVCEEEKRTAERIAAGEGLVGKFGGFVPIGDAAPASVAGDPNPRRESAPAARDYKNAQAGDDDKDEDEPPPVREPVSPPPPTETTAPPVEDSLDDGWFVDDEAPSKKEPAPDDDLLF